MERHGYIYKSNLGEGMYSKVVIAHSKRLKRRVAIKVIKKKEFNSEYAEKFLPREMEIIKTLNHPNIVKTFDVFESNKVFIVMELCAKGDLMKHIDTNGALPEYSSCRLFTQLCEAVQYLHNSDVAHRDLKCENMLLDTFFNLKVSDFGFSKRLTYVHGQVVLSKTFCGSRLYAAPEILRTIPYDPKVSDVWSMGVVLYIMLYGSMPYEATNVRKMVKIQTEHKINFPNIPSVSSEARELIRSILHPVVEQRITIRDILQTSWMMKGGRIEDKEEEEPSIDSSDPGEGPSTAASGHLEQR